MYKKIPNSIPLTEIQKEIIVGTLLGDGSISRSRNRIETAYLRFYHSIKQEAYCRFKASFLENLTNRSVEIKTYFNKSKNKNYTSARFETKFTKELFEFFQRFYRPKKSIPYDIADHLTPRALAIWYMDDGSIETIRDRRNGKIHYVRNAVRIHTNGFLKKDTEFLAKVLAAKYGLKFFIKNVKCNGNYWILHTRSRATIEKFIDILKPFIIPSMQYKIKTTYTKPMRKAHSPERILALMKKLNLRRCKDFLKYRRGSRLYESMRWNFGSIKNALKVI